MKTGSPVAALVLALLAFAASGCSLAGSDGNATGEDAGSSEALFEALLQFEQALDEPLQRPFYGGVSFGGDEPSVGNLMVFLLDADKRKAARRALRETLGEEAAGAVTIEVWEAEETVATEKLKRELPVFETAESTTSLDYDERIDRLSVGLRDLGDVSALEDLLARRGLARETMVIRPQHYVCTLEARPGLTVAVTSAATGEPLRTAEPVGIATDGAYEDSLRGGYYERDEVTRLSGVHERPGVYDVRVEAEGFQTWRRSGVTVEEGRCHVETVELNAELVASE